MKKFRIRVSEGLTLYTLLHFLADGICSLIIFSSLYNSDYNRCLFVFLVYNSLAFISQPLVGLLIDKYNQPRNFLIVSVILITIGVCTKNNYIVSSIFLGIGNSFFHISGGKYVTENTSNNISALGLFVSTGAIGLVLGQYYYSKMLLYVFIALLIISTLIIIFSYEEKTSSTEIQEKMKKSQRYLCIILLMIIVVIRALVGKVTIVNFNTNNLIFLLIGMATCLGKILGGVLSKYFGIMKTMIVSMIIAFICLIFFNSNMYFTLLGIITFNVSMPITLWYMNKLINKKQGFAFGLLAGCLFPGYLLGMLFTDILIRQILIGICSIISIVLLLTIRKIEYGTNN